MPKVTIHFNLPDEQYEYQEHLSASKMATIISEFTQLCREKTKYAIGPTATDWEDIRTEWWRILNEENYDPYTG